MRGETDIPELSVKRCQFLDDFSPMPVGCKFVWDDIFREIRGNVKPQ